MKDDNLVKELRELMELDLLGFEEFYNEQRSEAADHIEELEAENAALKARIKNLIRSMASLSASAIFPSSRAGTDDK